MAVDESGQEQTKSTSQPVKQVSVSPAAQALSSVQIETASESHPAFRMPPGWGENITLREQVRV